MKASEIKELSIKDLKEKIEDMEEQQANLLLTHSVSPLRESACDQRKQKNNCSIENCFECKSGRW